MSEIWRDIPGAFGKYQASSLGRIRSILRDNPRILKHEKKINKAGYYGVSLGRHNSQMVHRLVALTFLAIDNPLDMQVNHKNCDKLDNRVENLEWVTPKGNIEHAINMGRMDDWKLEMSERNTGVKNIKAKLTQDQVYEIRRLLDYGMRQADIAEFYGISQTAVSAIKRGKTWRNHLK